MNVWTVSEPKIGTMSQCSSVAGFFSENHTQKTFKPNRSWRRIFDGPLFTRWEQEPNLIVSCGFRSEKRVLRIKRSYGSRPFAVHLQEPLKPGYDLVFISRHDWKSQFDDMPNYYQMLGVPNRFCQEAWEIRRPIARSIYAPNGEKVVSIFLGGTNGAYVYDDRSHHLLADAVNNLIRQGWRILISVSRRSSEETLRAAMTLQSDAVEVWDRKADNPYVDFAAAADAFLIARDSITMPCEALSTGRPVYSLDLTAIPGERHQKFERFHADLQDHLKLTRRYDGSLEPFEYVPPREAERIANIINSAMKTERH